MPLKITFQIINGPMIGTKYSVDESIDLVLGRGSDCSIIIPRDVDPKISRHHCRIKIDIPKITVNDLGSTNGTFLDNEQILEEKEVSSGSVLRIGETCMKILVVEPVLCLDCHVIIPEKEVNRCFREGRVYLCDECYKQVEGQSLRNHEPISRTVFCSSCGEKFVDIVPRNSRTPYVCSECKSKTSHGLIKSRTIGGRHMAGIEQFEILEKIGVGGMGSVYKVRDLEEGGVLALKMMLPSVAQSQVLREDFVREMEHTRILFHPNIVRLIHTNDTSSDDLFFTMEYCEAGNVYDLVSRRSENMSIEEAYEIIEPCLDALEYAHEIDIHNIELNDGRIASARGLVHRDIKPSNIFLTKKKGKLLPKIADFGLAKAYDLAAATGNTMVGAVAGSLGYIPRQQVRNFKFCKPEVDVWAMAATLYFMLTKRTPRDFRKDTDEVTTVLETSAIPIRHRRPDISQSVANVIDLALVDSHELYYKTAREFSDALKVAIETGASMSEIETGAQSIRHPYTERSTLKITKSKV